MEIKNSKIEINPKDYSKIFGDWIKNPEILQEKFKNAKPYPYITIENFLNEELAETLSQKFPLPDEKTWHRYLNPLENKWVLDNVNEMPNEFSFILESLANSQVAGKLSLLTGIDGLEHDPTLHGSAIHSHGKNGNLAIHLDVSIYFIY
jgi:hypothetical protein